MKQENRLSQEQFHATAAAPSNQPERLSFDYWFQRHHYYHSQLIAFYKSLVPAHSRVLHLQAKNGYVLEALNPKEGVGVESDPASLAIARKRYPHYQFYADIASVPTVSFDYILLSLKTMETDDIHLLLKNLRRLCHDDTRIIVESYRSLWAPILSLTSKLGLRRPTTLKNWVSYKDLQGFFELTGFQAVTRGGTILMPLSIPLIAPLLNKVIAHMPLINKLCLHQWVIITPVKRERRAEHTVSVIITCRNEKGNIKAAIDRLPKLGKHTEIIFAEGHSTDGTRQEIERIMREYPLKDIRLYVQEGKGKGDAVRKGFEKAHGDILMILDGDLTTAPEELTKFYEAIIEGHADFVNGSRLVYGMESEAMGFASWLANNFFGMLVSWIIGQRISDTMCGTKVLWRKDYERIAANRAAVGLWDPFGDFDLLFGAAKLNLKIVDVPVHYKNRTYGTTNITRIKEVWFLLWMCVRAWWVLRVRS